MNTVRPEAAGLLLAPVFQAHVEGHGFDWATEVFATSAIHQARSVDSLGPFSLASLETGFVMATRLPATAGAPRIQATDA